MLPSLKGKNISITIKIFDFMTTTKKGAAKAAETNKVANANEVSKSTTAKVSAKADKAPLTEEEAAAKAAKKLDRLVTTVTNEVMAEVKNSVLGLSNWLNTFKRIAIKHDPQIAKQFEDDKKWFSFVTKTKMGLNHVVVLTEGKDKVTGEPTVIRSIKPCMWLPKTDKVSLPDYFGKAKVESYRINDKKGNGAEILISDGKELEVTRSVKRPVKVLVTDAEGNQFLATKMAPNAEGIMKPVYEEIDVVYIPQSQLDFDFNEINYAVKAAMLATFGSEAAAK